MSENMSSSFLANTFSSLTVGWKLKEKLASTLIDLEKTVQRLKTSIVRIVHNLLFYGEDL